jgi:hypothetical protein
MAVFDSLSTSACAGAAIPASGASAGSFSGPEYLSALAAIFFAVVFAGLAFFLSAFFLPVFSRSVSCLPVSLRSAFEAEFCVLPASPLYAAAGWYVIFLRLSSNLVTAYPALYILPFLLYAFLTLDAEKFPARKKLLNQEKTISRAGR